MQRAAGGAVTMLRAGALLLVVCLGTRCGDSEPPPAPPPEVRVVTAQPQTVPNVIELPARLHPVRIAEVRARVDGIVEKRLYEEGTDVQAGQPLFQIDPRPLRARLQAVEGALSRARAEAANAAQDVKRYEGLVAQQAISQQEYDAAVARLRTAQAGVAQARAEVESAQLALGYSTVVAPIFGRAGRAEVTEGALVSAAQATLLTQIEQLDPIYVNFSQSSSELLAVRRDIAAGKLVVPQLGNVKVSLVLEDGSVYAHQGRLNFFDLRIDEATGSAALRAEVPNPDRLLLPGQFVRARIDAGVRPRAFLLPQRAVTVTPQGATVLVVGAKNRVERRTVTVGDLKGDSWIVLSGLAAGDRVIAEGLQKVQPGIPVRVTAYEGPNVAGRPLERPPTAR